MGLTIKNLDNIDTQIGEITIAARHYSRLNSDGTHVFQVYDKNKQSNNILLVVQRSTLKNGWVECKWYREGVQTHSGTDEELSGPFVKPVEVFKDLIELRKWLMLEWEHRYLQQYKSV